LPYGPMRPAGVQQKCGSSPACGTPGVGSPIAAIRRTPSMPNSARPGRNWNSSRTGAGRRHPGPRPSC